jgi:hypothetical protein
MKPISAAEAFQEFTNWSKGFLVGFNFGRHDAAVNMNLRRAALEVKEPNLLIEVKDLGMSMLHFPADTTFSELSASDIARELSRLAPVTPSFKKCIGAKFSNGDFCFIFAE